MTAPSLSPAIDNARTRWLSGDATAWSEYVAQCSRLDAPARPHPVLPDRRARRSTDRLLPFRVDRRPIAPGV